MATKIKALEKRLDALASTLCRLLAGGICQINEQEGQRYDEHDGHDPHHIIGRDHRRLRWDQDNLIWLCRGHHLMAASENMGFGRDLDERVYIWNFPELQELEQELKLKIKELNYEK